MTQVGSIEPVLVSMLEGLILVLGMIVYAVNVPELVNVWMVYPPEEVTVPPVPRWPPA